MENYNPCLLERRGQEKVLSYNAGEIKWQIQISIKLLDAWLKMEDHMFHFFHNLFFFFLWHSLLSNIFYASLVA